MDQVGAQPVAWAVEVAFDLILQVKGEAALVGPEHRAFDLMRPGLEAVVLATLLAVDATGRPPSELPPEAQEQLVNLVHRQVPLDLILTFHRKTHSRLADHFMGACRRLVPVSDQAGQLELVSRVLFEFADVFATATSDSYAEENRRWLSGADAARAETVREFLAGKVSGDSASRRLAYELSNLIHVGLVLQRGITHNEQSSRLDETAAAILRSAGADAQLVVPVDRTEVWAWGAFRARQRATRIPLPAHSGLVAALGSAHHGAGGFRSTHREALGAARLTALDASTTRDGRVVRYDDVRILTLLTADVGSAASFMRDELGDLAAGGESNHILRETVRVYLECNRSPQEAARKLQVARNTVVYRIKRAEQILGHEVKDSQLELYAALRLADCFGRES